MKEWAMARGHDALSMVPQGGGCLPAEKQPSTSAVLLCWGLV